MEFTLKTIKCPSCGAVLQINDDKGTICCEYCDTRIALKSESEIRKEQELAEAAKRQAAQREAERAEKEKERIRKEEKLKAFTQKWNKIGIVLTAIGFLGLVSGTPIVIFLFFGIAAFVHCHNERTKMKAEISGNISLPKLLNYMSLSYTELKDALQNAGFSNIICIQSNKLPEHIEEKSTKVQSVIINGKRVQALHGYYAPNTEIKIVYDFVIKLPSLSRYTGSDYGLLVEALERSGFTNIECEPLNDLVLGIMKRPGTIESIEVCGKEIFSEDDGLRVTNNWYLPNSKITISYHSLNR